MSKQRSTLSKQQSFNFVAFDDVASALLLVWTGFYLRLCSRTTAVQRSVCRRCLAKIPTRLGALHRSLLRVTTNIQRQSLSTNRCRCSSQVLPTNERQYNGSDNVKLRMCLYNDVAVERQRNRQRCGVLYSKHQPVPDARGCGQLLTPQRELNPRSLSHEPDAAIEMLPLVRSIVT